MGDRSAVLARVRQSAVQGERYAAAFEALGEKKRETAYPILLAYIRDRFLLTPELCASDNILDLADASLRHRAGITGIPPGRAAGPPPSLPKRCC